MFRICTTPFTVLFDRTSRATCRSLGVLSCLIAVVVISTSQSATASQTVYESALNSTVWIWAGNNIGTGVLVDQQRRLIATNEHVVENHEHVVAYFPIHQQGRVVTDSEYYLINRQRLGIPGRVVAVDRQRDIAIVQLERLPETAREIEFGPSAQPGQTVHAIGNPDSSDALWIYSHGYVRANYYKRFGERRMQVVETQMPINEGDSGGPILDDAGRLVGLSQSYQVRGRLVSNGVDIAELSWFLSRVRNDQPEPELAQQPAVEAIPSPWIKFATGSRNSPKQDALKPTVLSVAVCLMVVQLARSLSGSD